MYIIQFKSKSEKRVYKVCGVGFTDKRQATKICRYYNKDKGIRVFDDIYACTKAISVL